MSYKNLSSPAANSSVPTKEKIANIPMKNDPTKNDDPVDITTDGEGTLEWPKAKFDQDNKASGGNRLPMKGLK